VSELQRLVVEFKAEELVVRTLYRTEGGASPNTKGRRREVEELTREGLRSALEALAMHPATLPRTGEGGKPY
jgi:hypothetical protein